MVEQPCSDRDGTQGGVVEQPCSDRDGIASGEGSSGVAGGAACGTAGGTAGGIFGGARVRSTLLDQEIMKMLNERRRVGHSANESNGRRSDESDEGIGDDGGVSPQ